MKKLLAIVLSLVILMLSLCACGAQSEQSGSSTAENNDNSSKQVVTTEEVTTQPATEPDYENTNFIAQPPQGKPNYKVEEIYTGDIYNSDVCTSPDYYSIDGVVYDINGNMVVDFKNIAITDKFEGFNRFSDVCDIYKEYAVVCFNERRYLLYNLKTGEMRNINDVVHMSEEHSLDFLNGVISVYSSDIGHGALDLNLNPIIPMGEYSSLWLASPELFIVGKDGKRGLIDFNNNVIADFKYEIISEFSNSSALEDFEKNINKYAFARTSDDKYFLLDGKGNETPIEYEVTNIWLYDNVTYIKYQDRETDSYVISDLNSNVIVKNVEGGYCNGYCVSYDRDTGDWNLVDSKGKTVYSKNLGNPNDKNGKFSFAIKQKNKINPVDQNGLFLIENYDSETELTEYTIMDLSFNEVFSGNENCDIDPYGYGLFGKVSEKNFSVYRVTAN